MTKAFAAVTADKLEVVINEWLKKNPRFEITALSHANVVAHGMFSWNQWHALVVYREVK